MANLEQLAILKQGADEWFKWRRQNSDIYIDFRNVNLVDADLREFDLGGVDFSGANLTQVNLEKGNLMWANLQSALLTRMNFSYVRV